MPADPRDGSKNGDDAISPYMRQLGGGPSAEGERMLNRLAARMFGISPAEPDRIARFELRGKIGAGAMGVVYEAWDPELDRRVALKLLHDAPGRRLDPNSNKRLLREAKAMARLRHPNVVQVHEAGTHAGQVFVAMELIEGVSLRAWLVERERPWRAIVGVFAKAGRGLAAAHAAGLVHRDFKPDNVLIEDGRVFVGDFGLARSSEAEPETITEPAQPGPSTTITRTGAFVGTPAYMAPEAFCATSPDPRADQYSFCASLYEALYGTRPWAGETIAELRVAKEQPIVGSPAARVRGRKVPRWLRRLVLRGLAPAPEQRFASMDELLLELQRGLRRDRWLRRELWIGLGVAGLLVGGTWALGMGMGSDPAPAPCSDSPEQLAEVWNPARRTRVLAALSAGGFDFADALAERTVTVLDTHAQSWIAAHQRACESTHVYGTQSARALDLRMRCLDRRRHEFDALLTRFDEPSETDRLESLRAAHALTPTDTCDNVELLESTTPLPEDPRVRDEVERMRDELDEINAAFKTGAHSGLEARTVALLESARELGYKPLMAEVGVALGSIFSHGGKPNEAAEVLEQAIVDAQASGHDEIAARAMAIAIFVNGWQLRKTDDERLIRQARALLERLGDPPGLLSIYVRNVGTFEVARGRNPQARAHIQHGIALLTEIHGDSHFLVAEARANLASVERRLGNLDSAAALYERAKQDLEASFGPTHPALHQLLNNMAVLSMNRGRDDEAEAALRQALELATKTMADQNETLGHAHNNLGNLQARQGRYLEALANCDAAIEQWTKEPGAEHLLAHPLTSRGLVRLELGDAVGAREDLERAFAIREARETSLVNLGQTEFILARALAQLGEPEAEVTELAKRALERLGDQDGDLVTRAEIQAWLAAR